jgi:hypothetical protein
LTIRCHSSRGDADNRSEKHHACVVDQRVEPSELAHRLGHRPGCDVRIGDVGLDDKGVVLTDSLRQRFEAIPSSGHQGDPCSLVCQCCGGGLSDAAAGARHQRDGPFQFLGHLPYSVSGRAAHGHGST